MKIKVDEKNQVLRRGAGEREVALDASLGAVYAVRTPGVVLATRERRGWLAAERPAYHSGGWGRHGVGDAEGAGRWDNMVMLVRAVGGTLDVLPVKALDVKLIQKELEKFEARKKLMAYAKKTGRYEDLMFSARDTELKARRKVTGIHGKPRGEDPFKIIADMRKLVGVFLNQSKGKAKVHGYTADKNAIRLGSVCVAFRDSKGDVWMNSASLAATAFENRVMGGQSIVQSEVRKASKYNIPFNVLESAGLLLTETKIIEQGPEETYLVHGDERHFTGALLLENSGRKFLMDIDRIEITHGIFNAFFVELAPSIMSIAEGYESMKPPEVKEAEAAGVEVRRQGEWFFIKQPEVISVKETCIRQWQDGTEAQVNRAEIRHGKGRPNLVWRPVGFGDVADSLVCGIVSHTGREHKDLNLGMFDAETGEALGSISMRNVYGENRDRARKMNLWKVVPNTTVANFTIQGDVD